MTLFTASLVDAVRRRVFPLRCVYALGVCLGLENLAMTVSYMSQEETAYRCDRFHLGASAYSFVTDTFAADAKRSSRTTVLLGDPCVRQTYISQVQNFTAHTSGVPITLNWSNAPEATAGYRIYRAPSVNPAAWSFLKDINPGVTTTTDSSPSGTQAYLIKALAVVTGGFGSFTKSILGSVAAVLPSN